MSRLLCEAKKFIMVILIKNLFSLCHLIHQTNDLYQPVPLADPRMQIQHINTSAFNIVPCVSCT